MRTTIVLVLVILFECAYIPFLIHNKEAIKERVRVKPKPVVTVSRSVTPNVIEKRALTEREVIDGYVKEISAKYNVNPSLIHQVIWYESRYDVRATNGRCVGLMQLHTYWQAKRAKRLGVTDLYDPYGNILVGVDYLSGLLSAYDEETALKIYRGEREGVD